MFFRNRTPLWTATALSAALVLTAAGCSSDSPEEGSDSGAPSSDAEVSGTITVLTHRTDMIQNGKFDEYVTQFQKLYPDVDVEFEGITAYEDEVPIRLSTGDFGDVLTIPRSVKPEQFDQFFEPFGPQADLDATYLFTAPISYDGTAYGIAQGGNATGIVYNKRVFEAAGITTPPKTFDDFTAAMQAIKDNTDAVPLYTNYKDAWPLGDLWRNLGVSLGDADAQNEMSASDAPWDEGSGMYYVDSFLFDAVAAGYTEPDPLTTNWEDSKVKLGTGEIGMMVLGTWAIAQMQSAAEDAGAAAADIGYLAYPTTAPDDQVYAAVQGDYYFGINNDSDAKEAARAWVDWFVNDSPYAADEGFISAVRTAPLPPNLADLDALGAEIFELTPEPAGEEGTFAKIDSESEIGITQGDYRQKLVDIARGAASGDKASAFADLNSRWAAARSSVG